MSTIVSLPDSSNGSRVPVNHWMKNAVMRTVAAGATLTEAAHAAGFASSAHLSSTFKRMFGLRASDLLALGVAIDMSEDEVLSANEPGRHPATHAARAA